MSCCICLDRCSGMGLILVLIVNHIERPRDAVELRVGAHGKPASLGLTIYPTSFAYQAATG